MAVAQGPLGDEMGEKSTEQSEEKEKMKMNSQERSRIGEIDRKEKIDKKEKRGIGGIGGGEERNSFETEELAGEKSDAPKRATKCYFVPIRNLCTSSLRKEVEKKFPRKGIKEENILLDTDTDIIKTINLFEKNPCEPCFQVCSII